MKKWFIAYIPANSENKIRKIIDTKEFDGIEIDLYYPKEEVVMMKNGKVSMINRPIFPNYLFMQIDTEKDRSVFKALVDKTPILRFLKYSLDDNISVPYVLTDDEIKCVMGDKPISKKKDVKEDLGKKVCIKKGPYKDLYGIVVAIVKGTNELTVEMEINSLKIKNRINRNYLEFEDDDNLIYYEEDEQ